MFGTWSSWGAFAQLFMWASLAASGGITCGLVAWGARRGASGSPGPLGILDFFGGAPVLTGYLFVASSLV